MPVADKSSKQSIIEHQPFDTATVRETALSLLAYCRANDWAGYDPYDALNSRVFKALPLLNFKLARLTLTQAVKRCPINLRPLLLVPKSPNPKGIALFLSSLIKLSKLGLLEDNRLIHKMAEKLLALRSPNQTFTCWGYNFDWQTRSELVPRGSPNIICSAFAAHALLDAFEQSRESSYLTSAVNAADFILNVLFWREDNLKACFSYTPLGRTEIHNANLLGAALLCRTSQYAEKKRFLEPALDATRYSASKQHDDGSWDYGESPHQRWIDNFHTGYNLVALKRIKEYTGAKEWDGCIQKGLDFYKARFFREDGAPKYFHNATYPIDIHSVSQSIITLIEFGDFAAENVPLAHSVLNWAMDYMWDSRGFFYFQRHKHFTVRTPFIRWSEAWMLLALSSCLEADCS